MDTVTRETEVSMIQILSAALLLACLLLPLSPGLAEPSKADQPRIRFAVIPWKVEGYPDLGTAITFDLEKRLERWPNLEAVDRLDLARVLRRTQSKEAAVAELFAKHRVDTVVVITGSCRNGLLSLMVELWETSGSPARSFPVSGSLSDFFRCQDNLTARVVAALRLLCPGVPAPPECARLSLQPAESFEAWMLAIRGKLAMEKGDNAEARSLLNRSLAEETRLWWSHYWLGAVEFHEENYGKAIEHSKAALALDPDLYSAIYANLAYCYDGLGDKARADYYTSEFERRTGKKLTITMQ